MALQLYRQSKLGDCLAEALDEMVGEDKITGELATKVMAEFDAAIYNALENKLTTKTTFKGHLDSYRFCDQVWTLIMSDTTFHNETGTGNNAVVTDVKADKVKLVCVDARLFQS